MDSETIRNNISVYSFAHALTDAVCAATLFGIFFLGLLGMQEFIMLLLVYTLLAFGLQAPFGYLIDSWNKPVKAASLGLFLSSSALLLVGEPWLAVIFCGIGNALFHVGGGIISLNLKPGKASMPGIYVSTGAFGLMAGTLIGKSGIDLAWPFIIISFIVIGIMNRIKPPKIITEENIKGEFKWFEITIILLLLTIAVRGLVGLSLVLPWKSDMTLLLWLTSAVVLGKALGGVLGDRFGWSRVALTGLVFSAPLLAFFQEVPYLVILGAFLFNLTMPITLTALAKLFPGRAGFAFGLTTLALIVGAIPAFTELKLQINQPIMLLALILGSAIALYFGLRLSLNKFRTKFYKSPKRIKKT